MACCGGRSCTCKIEVGTGLGITGSGSVDDPYQITSDVGGINLDGDDNTRFNVVVTPGAPTLIGVDYAATAKLDDIPDVQAPTPTAGQVLAWNGTRWTAQTPGSAPPGSVNTDETLSGDGSAGDPLGVVTAEDRGLTTAPTGADQGVGIRDSYINQFVRKFNNQADRAAASPSAEIVNTFTALGTNPGQLDYWDGTQWQRAGSSSLQLWGTEVMLELSGPYTGGPLTHVLAKVDDDVNADGEFTVIGTSQLAGFSGVMIARFQATNQHPPFYPVAFGDTNRIRVTAYVLGSDNVTLPNGTNVHGFVEAWLY